MAGEVDLEISIGGETYPLPCLVTDQITEVILGLSWLESNEVTWTFATQSKSLGNQTIPLKEVAADDMCRRVVVLEDTKMPPLSEIDVPVTLIYPHLQGDAGEWITIPKRSMKT